MFANMSACAGSVVSIPSHAGLSCRTDSRGTGRSRASYGCGARLVSGHIWVRAAPSGRPPRVVPLLCVSVPRYCQSCFRDSPAKQDRKTAPTSFRRASHSLLSMHFRAYGLRNACSHNEKGHSRRGGPCYTSGAAGNSKRV